MWEYLFEGEGKNSCVSFSTILHKGNSVLGSGSGCHWEPSLSSGTQGTCPWEQSLTFRRLSLYVKHCGFTRRSLEILSSGFFLRFLLALVPITSAWGCSNLNKGRPYEPTYPAHEMARDPTVLCEADFDHSGPPIKSHAVHQHSVVGSEGEQRKEE